MEDNKNIIAVERKVTGLRKAKAYLMREEAARIIKNEVRTNGERNEFNKD